MRRHNPGGFTLIELMIVVVIISVLVAVGIANYGTMMIKSKEGSTRGNLATLRSALSIYYGDNEDNYPADTLASLVEDRKYLDEIKTVRVPPFHGESSAVTAETTPADTGTWSYNNDRTSGGWGQVRVGCLHADSRSNIWTTY